MHGVSGERKFYQPRLRKRDNSFNDGGAGTARNAVTAEIKPLEPDPGNTGVEKLAMNKKLVLLMPAMACATCIAMGKEGLAIENDTLSTVVLNQIEVTANRATAKTPVAFTNVTKRELLRHNDGRDLTYLIQSTPSVTVTSDAGAGVGYSSMRVRGTDGSRINVMANGVPINNPESHNVYWVNMPDLASSLRDVQIQRGVGTSANGAGAFGASVNMVTDAPSEDPYAELSAAYGMYNTNRETLRVGSGLINDHWSFDARISHLGSDGYIDRASSALWSYFGQAAYTNYNTMIRLLAFGGKERTYMAWDYASKEDMEKYGRRYNPCGQYTDDRGNVAYYPDQFDNYTQHHFQLLLSQNLSESLKMNATLHYTDDYGFYEQYKTGRTLEEYGLTPFVDADGNKIKKSDLVRLKKNDNGFGGGQLNFNYTSGGWNAMLGSAVNWFHGRHFGEVSWVRNYVGAIDPLQRYYDNTGRKFDANVFLRGTYTIDRHWNAYADFQYRHIYYTIEGASDNWDWNISAPAVLDVNRKWDFFNPKAGVNYQSGSHRAFASWSVAHKEPTRTNFTDGDSNHPPRAERLFDYEIGYTFSTSTFTAGANLYYMDYKDQLVLTGQLSDTGNSLSENVPDSYRMGVELQAAWKPVQWFDWQANATLSRNRIKNFVEYVYEDGWTNPVTFDRGDTPIAFSPGFIFNNAFNFKAAGMDASLSTRYVGRQYLSNSHDKAASLDPYCVTDIHLGYTFPGLLSTREVRVGLSIYNLFNHKYFSNGYASSGYSVNDKGEKEFYLYTGYAAQAPIHFLATVTLKF